MEQVRSLPGLLVLLVIVNIRHNVSLQIDLTRFPAASLDQVSLAILALISQLTPHFTPQVSSHLPAELLDLIHSHPSPPVYFSRGQSSLASQHKTVCKTAVKQVRPELILLLCNWQLEY